MVFVSRVLPELFPAPPTEAVQLPAVMRPAGKVTAMVSDDTKAVAVVTETVTVPDVVTIAVVNADSVGRVTQPTQGVATCAATVSLFVWICRPEAASWGAVGLTVSPLQVTVTAPAAMLALKVIMTLFATVVSVPDTVTDPGEVTPQVPGPFCEMRPDGKVRVMVSVDTKAVAVVKETAPAPAPVPVAVGNADSVGRVTQPTQGVATCAA